MLQVLLKKLTREVVMLLSDGRLRGGTVGMIEARQFSEAVGEATRRRIAVVVCWDTGGVRVQEGPAALAATSAVGIALAWRLRKKPRRKKSGRAPRYPIVLVHGVMGFDAIEVAGKKAEYFRGVEARLKKAGAKVVALRLPHAR